MDGMKVAVIGGGSSYTPELVEGLIARWEALPVGELWLMDVDEHKLEVCGALARRMVEGKGLPMEVLTTGDRVRAIAGAQFVVSQVRVGGLAARVLDERIPLLFGCIGQETTGPGGFAKALRTIPVALGIAEDVAAHAPDAFLLNFTNPAGLVTEALLRYSDVRAIGLCNLPIGAEMRVAKRFGVAREQVALDWVGLNHLNWIRGATVDGKDVWELVFESAVQEARAGIDDGWLFPAELLETLGMIPCSYLHYFYDTPRILAEQKAAPRTRGEEVQEIERELLALYEDPALVEKPALLEKRGGAYYSTAAVSLMAALANDGQERHIVNTRNCGAIAELPEDAVVEVGAMIGAQGARAERVEALPLPVAGLVQAVKAYESLAAEAGVEGDRRLALQALAAHPLAPSFEAAQGLLAALLEAHRAYLPQFFGGA